MHGRGQNGRSPLSRRASLGNSSQRAGVHWPVLQPKAPFSDMASHCSTHDPWPMRMKTPLLSPRVAASMRAVERGSESLNSPEDCISVPPVRFHDIVRSRQDEQQCPSRATQSCRFARGREDADVTRTPTGRGTGPHASRRTGLTRDAATRGGDGDGRERPGAVSAETQTRDGQETAPVPLSRVCELCAVLWKTIMLKKYGTKIRCLHARRTIAVETDRHTTLNWNDALYVSPLPPSINHRSSAAAVDAWAMTPRYANVCANVDKYVERRLTPCGTGWRSILVCVLAGSFILLTRARVALDIGRAPASSASMPG